jgi:hypothetical protein
VANNGLVGFFFHVKAETRRKLYGSQNPHRVFSKANTGFADCANQPLLQVSQTIDVVDYDFSFDIVEEPVDCKVSSLGIFGVRTPYVVAVNQEFAAVVSRVGAWVRAEGCGLDNLATEEDVGESKASTNDSAVAEEMLDLVRRRARRDVVG